MNNYYFDDFVWVTTKMYYQMLKQHSDLYDDELKEKIKSEYFKLSRERKLKRILKNKQ